MVQHIQQGHFYMMLQKLQILHRHTEFWQQMPVEAHLIQHHLTPLQH
jgi:hypothetical protein